MAAKKRRPAAAGKRSQPRFSAEEARDAILLATEKLLLEVGPQGLRLQEIARAVGLSHPTVIHHFGSREGLVNAVAVRAVRALHRDLLACFTDVPPDADPKAFTLDTLDRIDQALRKRGHARVLAWLALNGIKVEKELLLRDLALVIHAARKELRPETTLEESLFGVLLTTAAMFGLALVGTEILPTLGLPDDEGMHQRFRAWFAAMLTHELYPGGASP